MNREELPLLSDQSEAKILCVTTAEARPIARPALPKAHIPRAPAVTAVAALARGSGAIPLALPVTKPGPEKSGRYFRYA